jgi:DeoR/GlpR family transcriptional regulator of sugar metabolism
MRSSVAEIHSRRERLSNLLRQEGYLSVSQLSKRFLVSEATIRRDLIALEKDRQITRTFGGALSEYDALFISFHQRKAQNRGLKQRIAKTAVTLLRPGQTIFLDAGSTVLAVASQIVASGLKDLTIVTNSLPIAEVFTSGGTSEVHLLGGHLLPHQLIVVGLGAGLSLSAWRFDLAFLGAQAMDREGLWNSQDGISDFQRHLCGRSSRSVFCLDESKLGQSGPSFLMQWREVDTLITTATPDQLSRISVTLEGDRHIQA